MAGTTVGYVTHYYGDLHVAVLKLTDMIHVGDWLHLVGNTTDFVQPVVSLQMNHNPVDEAGPGDEVALTVNDRVRPHDLAYCITTDEAREIQDGRLVEPAW